MSLTSARACLSLWSRVSQRGTAVTATRLSAVPDAASCSRNPSQLMRSSLTPITTTRNGRGYSWVRGLKCSPSARSHSLRSCMRPMSTRPGRRLLDVGCAAGTFMAIAAHDGWETTGVELGASTAEAGRSRGLDVHTGTLRDVAPVLAPGSFDLVTFWDVLRHVRDPRDELSLARELLHPGGLIAATMPNIAGLYPQVTYRLIARPTGRWEYPELPAHLHDFDPRTITRLLIDAGYRDVRVRTIPTPFWYYRDRPVRRPSRRPGAWPRAESGVRGVACGPVSAGIAHQQ